MQQVLYQSEGEFHAYTAQMLTAGWIVGHYQPNDDGTVSVTWVPAPRQTSMAVYDGDFAYRAGVEWMLRQGWQVANVAMAQNGRPFAEMLVVGVFAKKQIKYTVIYTR